MKKLLAITLITLFGTSACNANDQIIATEEQKRCEALSKETGKEYKYGEGLLKSTNLLIHPPCGMPVPGKSRPPCPDKEYNIILHVLDQNNNKTSIHVGPIQKFARDKPKLIMNRKYGYCYEPYNNSEKPNVEFVIRNYSTLRLIKE